MSRVTSLWSDLFPGFPRVSGDEPLTYAKRQLAQVFSPRERG